MATAMAMAMARTSLLTQMTEVAERVMKPSLIRSVVISLLVAGLGWASFAAAFTSVTRRAQPQLALRLSPDDPVALAQLANKDFAKTPLVSNLERIEALALAAIKSQALHPRAVAQLAYVRQLQGNQSLANTLFATADRLSSREILTHVWYIEKAAATGLVSGVLKRYDMALRTSQESSLLLFPILDRALADPAVAAGLVRYFRMGAPWTDALVLYALNQSSTPQHVGAVIAAAGGLRPAERSDVLTTALLSKLLAQQQFGTARRLYRTMPGASDEALTSLTLNARSIDQRFSGFAWEHIAAPDITAVVERAQERGGYQLVMSAESGARGRAIRKLLFLAPGQYLVSGKAQRDTERGAGTAELVLQCASGNAQIIDRSPIVAGNKPTAINAVLAVEAGCPVQYASLAMSGGDSQQGYGLAITDLSLRRIGRQGQSG